MESTAKNMGSPDLEIDRTKDYSTSSSLYISNARESLVCDFWITSFAPGSGTLSELLDCDSPAELLQKAVELGLSETEPVLLANTTSSQPRRYYLLPSRKLKHSSVQMIGKSSEVIAASLPTKVGIYLDPLLLGADSLPIMKGMLCSLIKQNIPEMYLYVGEIGVNSLTNLCSSIKKEADIGHAIYIFH